MPFTKNDPNINREGRPLGSFSLVTLLKNKLQEIPEGMEKESYAHLLVKKAIKKAVGDGDINMIKDMFNRVDGMPTQPLEHSGQVSILSDLVEKIENE